MHISKRLWAIAITVALYFYFLLPATAQIFYELYHLTNIGPIYWGYSSFKAAGYYFSVYEYRFLVCLVVAAIIIVVPTIMKKFRGT